MPFQFKEYKLSGVMLVVPKVFNDTRGFFLEGYKKSDFIKNGIDVEFNQDNHSKSVKGVLRGLHYQAEPKGQAKLIRCIQGAIYDVVVDIRKTSPTFGRWIGEFLNEDNKYMLYVPTGFAHGFLTLSNEAQILYKASGEYSKEHDRGIRWNDSDINIDWGIDFEPILSEKDKNQPFLKDVKDLI